MIVSHGHGVKTYCKPNCKPQYLSYHSQHPEACKMGIYKCEATRHLLNCSRDFDYDSNMVNLRESLRRRGYPTLPDIDYDAQKRAALLDKLKCKCNFNRTKERTTSPIMAIKVQFSREVEQLRLPRRLKQLVAELRAEVGHEFLNGTRLVTAYTVQRSMFRQTYYMNFLPHTRRVFKESVRGWRDFALRSSLPNKNINLKIL